MTLYQQWLSAAYDRNGQSIKSFWDKYMPTEQKVYENMLVVGDGRLSGTVAELGERFDMPAVHICGFLDGIKEALDSEIDMENLEEDTPVNAVADFSKLYKKMVEYKAEHLYSLPQWDNIFTEEECKAMYTEQKRSKTVVRDDKIGRNDPCPCGSGRKYKHCCGAAV